MENPIREFETKLQDKDYPLIKQLILSISELSPLEKHDEFGKLYGSQQDVNCGTVS
jgi:hypothetical protein